VINVLSQANSLHDLLSTQGMSSIYNFSKEFATIGKEAFIETHGKAKLTGKMLAHYLTEDKCAF
jgi:hypothetical protein